MTEETEIYERRADHGKRAALLRLRLVEAEAVKLLEGLAVSAGSSDVWRTANELSWAINEVVEYMRQTPPEGV